MAQNFATTFHKDYEAFVFSAEPDSGILVDNTTSTSPSIED